MDDNVWSRSMDEPSDEARLVRSHAVRGSAVGVSSSARITLEATEGGHGARGSKAVVFVSTSAFKVGGLAAIWGVDVAAGTDGFVLVGGEVEKVLN